LQALQQAFGALVPRPTSVDVAVAGLTGFDGSSETGEKLAKGIATLVQVERVILTNDAVTSYLGAIGFEPGAVVAAGTGAIALAGEEGGRFARSDGWGYILGDDGGGYYVGRRGLASALRARDGRGGSEALSQRAQQAIGLPETIKQRIYEASNPASEVAKFATEVAGAAREGDPTSSQIWADAARELVLTTKGALQQVFEPGTPVTVSWIGSLFEAQDVLLEPFKRNMAKMWPAARLTPPAGDALRGAQILARRAHPPMFGPLIHEFEMKSLA
jgi:glucosamine kinase